MTPTSPDTSIRSRLGEVSALLDHGRYDAAREQAPALLALLRDSSQRLCPASERAEAGCFAAESFLTLFDPPRAEDALLHSTTSGRFGLKELTDLAAAEPLPGARLASVAANYYFRISEYDLADRYVTLAESLLSKLPMTPAAQDAQLWNLAYGARIFWRQEHRRTLTDGCLGRLVRLLGQHVEGSSEARLNALEAFALDLAANVHWSRGQLEDGQRKAYRALYLLCGRNLQDRIRLGSVLFTVGRLESTFGDPLSLRVARQLLRDAQRELAGHPFCERALIQEARTLQRSGDTAASEACLDRVASRDHRLVAEVALTRAWIAFDRAQWDKVVDNAGLVLEHGSKSPRLKAEAQVHLGRALVQKGDFATAIKDLNVGLDLATRFERVRIEALAQLELAAAYSRAGQRPRADEAWARANELVAQLRSKYLNKRRDEIASELKRGWLHEVPTPNWDDEKHRFQRAFFRRLLDSCEGDYQKASGLSGAARNTIANALRDPAQGATGASGKRRRGAGAKRHEVRPAPARKSSRR